MRVRSLLITGVSAAALAAATVLPAATSGATTTPRRQLPAAAVTALHSAATRCHNWGLMCTEVYDSEAVFGEDHYVGHDEPSLLFYSNQPGSGNRARYDVVLPRQPSSIPINGRSYDFMLHIAPWFGMAMCNPQSWPLHNKTCTPDSDSNIRPASDPNHPGAAYMELQLYPPGYVRQFTGGSCDSRAWCAALVIWSLAIDPVTGKTLNDACANRILGGLEYGNFAYVTRNGKPQGPPNPLQFDPIRSGAPDPKRVLFMNGGDRLTITMKDTPAGFRVDFADHTTGGTGSMTASAANGFGQIRFAPKSGCDLIPYSFHPMYSTSSPQTRVPWAAHSYNVAFSDEIGHFDWCTDVDASSFTCTGQEGKPGDREKTDADDQGCFPFWASTLVELSGCLGTNTGFDGASYQKLGPGSCTATACVRHLCCSVARRQVMPSPTRIRESASNQTCRGSPRQTWAAPATGLPVRGAPACRVPTTARSPTSIPTSPWAR